MLLIDGLGYLRRVVVRGSDPLERSTAGCRRARVGIGPARQRMGSGPPVSHFRAGRSVPLGHKAKRYAGSNDFTAID